MAVLIFIALPATGQDSTQAVSPDSLAKSLPVTYEFVTIDSSVKKLNMRYEPWLNLSSEQKKRRVWLVGGAHVALWGISFIALDQAWYKDYPKSSFHFFNDNREWQQMDKAGHVWTAYQMSRISGALWNWAGLKPHQSAWLGGLSGVAYQSIIEIQDGFSDEWGFSWGDMAANITGSALYTAQQLLWQEQRLQVKLSYWPYDYNAPELSARRDQLFGKSVQERILKDYNSQTYWLSANLRSFLPNTHLPKWLNLSVGYSADGMLGGHENRWTDKGGEAHYRPDIARTRHFYLSPDIDLTKIKTKSRFLRSALSLLNMVKIPAPTLELTSKGKVKGHWVYF
ncbi:DUF2279 domain-containing protein [Paraflavitalea sp. CAU 1676]|uniref:DUF2279 domain-containing protein n=1 Tax=Paraflavitalea sp. CAU 1676 TaxID=3032598 RepID=UPI0023DC9C3E|nr:DUF2279 domain-containing protein [Paraflavitalea sp. CAU 1676]MDF2192057.1 DUF2279 domain-containing protein [Paraflavitalea sp. CAU 1676]